MMVDGWWYAPPRQIKLEDSDDKLATTLPAAYPCNAPTSLQTLSCLLLEIINALETTNYSTNKISWSLSLPLCDTAWAGKCSNTATTSSERQMAIQYNQDIRSIYKTIASSHHSLKKRISYLCVGLLRSEKCQYWCIKEQFAKQRKDITSKVLYVPCIQQTYNFFFFKKNQQRHLGMNVILLHSNHRHVLTTHVAIFRVVSTRMHL